MNATVSSGTATADRRLWYQLSTGPAIVFAIIFLLLLGLNVMPRRVPRLGEVYPGAGNTPVVKEFGFPQTALCTVSTEHTNSMLEGLVQHRPAAVTIEYVSGGPKLKWSAATQSVSFDNGSRTWTSQGSIGVNVAACLAVLLATFAVCKWWSNKRDAGLPANS